MSIRQTQARVGTSLLNNEGVAVTYRRRYGIGIVALSGWYDSLVGIAPIEMTLAAFLTELGITLADCTSALGEVEL